MRWQSLAVGLIAGLAGALLAVVTVSAASIVVAPAVIPAGGTVTVSGNVLGPGGKPGCVVPGGVTLISGAFAGQGSFMHEDVEGAVDAAGRFSVVARVLPGVAPATYTITGRCGGGNLGVVASLTVTPALPMTGAPAGQPATAGGWYTPLGSILLAVALGAGLVSLRTWGRPRRSA